MSSSHESSLCQIRSKIFATLITLHNGPSTRIIYAATVVNKHQKQDKSPQGYENHLLPLKDLLRNNSKPKGFNGSSLLNRTNVRQHQQS